MAVAAATSGGFSLGRAGGLFLLAAIGGVFVGAVIAFAVRLVRSVVREPLMLNTISLATPFAAYLLGEQLHASGVLAGVVAGLLVGHDTPRAVSGASRHTAPVCRRLVDFLLEGFVFLLIGEQLPTILTGLDAYSTGTIVVASSRA